MKARLFGIGDAVQAIEDCVIPAGAIGCISGFTRRNAPTPDHAIVCLKSRGDTPDCVTIPLANLRHCDTPDSKE